MTFILFKLLFFISSLIPASSASSEGWVEVNDLEEEVSPVGVDESDPSLWVVFAKKIGSEKILAAFPVEPSYKYTAQDGSEMEVFAKAGGDEHLLQVLKPSEDLLGMRKVALKDAIFVSETRNETGVLLIYWQAGYWFIEQLISTKEHSYILQTKNSELHGETHRKFNASFDLEIHPA